MRAGLTLAAMLLGAACSSAGAAEFGVYRGPGCDGRARVPAFESFAGRRVERIVDALSQENWSGLESSIDWITGCWRNSGVKLTLSVPMMPKGDGGTLADGLKGGHDETFRHVARSLVAAGYPDATVRIGWEFNGDWWPWAAHKDPDSFIALYRRIVALMRGVEGSRFQFEWCPNHGRHAIDPTRVYPGDDVVDVIGMDVYNEYWSELLANSSLRWRWYLNQPFGLRWHRSFAQEHGKALAYSEWGTGTRPDGHGGGDDPIFVNGMADWFAEARPLYQSYWDHNSAEFSTQLSSGPLTQSAAAFAGRFGPAPCRPEAAC